MNTKERKAYFGHLWPEACLANEWDVKDDAQRRAVTVECMRLIRGPQIESTSALGPDEITALFVYLRHLGDSGSLEKSADWVSCQEDYKTFNRARQADWHERALYGAGKNRLDRNRFGGEASAAGSPLGTLDKKQVAQRHLTMATRHQRKQREERREGTSCPKGEGQHAPGVAKPAITTPPKRSAPHAVNGAELSADVPF